ncbi:hypothetical protein ABT282_08660 [Streptomyces sp. NPDC000927]|uniref:WYL domain-containing protein n=1 Tax=Streptomyces sp. NPDC000927 TaxID=3154371 RepID=UPI003331A1D2
MALSMDRRLILLENAARKLRPVEIDYRCGKDNQVETRVIEIDEIPPNKKTGEPYIRAYCRMRRETRNFNPGGILRHRTLRTVGYQAVMA